ncbi:hypothetical protein Nepgr_029625 [Nepenthes gracilis]|uniref:Uncharacterized protein n=1 Tax=Nepenthes gracilis TaxID=150966 RepID=A0AAD3TFP9_NEPGR|nr:hypothetical protein Nepgr_029625 [Nepenthes gracilis]
MLRYASVGAVSTQRYNSSNQARAASSVVRDSLCNCRIENSDKPRNTSTKHTRRNLYYILERRTYLMEKCDILKTRGTTGSPRSPRTEASEWHSSLAIVAPTEFYALTPTDISWEFCLLSQGLGFRGR